jgi:hypothetical protein
MPHSFNSGENRAGPMLWICTMSGRLRTARQVDRNEWYTASKPFIFVDGRSMKVMLG